MCNFLNVRQRWPRKIEGARGGGGIRFKNGVILPRAHVTVVYCFICGHTEA